jgi:uncharacterized repeat protein (TIGR01451 family)
MSHSGTFTQRRSGTYTITVMNNGGPTNGLVTVTSTLPSVFTAPAVSGSGWTCAVPTLSCTRSDVLGNGASYPPITLQVDIASNAPASVINSATISGGGDLNTANNTVSDPTTIIPAADLSLSIQHSGTFTQGQRGTYTITVMNNSGPTNGLVTVTSTLPSALTATAISGSGWTCVVATLSCTRSDILGNGGILP